jgi:hypothetical protein
MYFGAVLTVLGSIIFFATTDQLRDSLADSHPLVSQEAIDRAVSRASGREVVHVILGVGLWTWMAAKNGQGRRWARVTATVLGIINLAFIALGYLLVFANANADDRGDSGALVDYTVPYLVLSAISAILAVVILVQLYRPDASDYYDRTTRWNAALALRGY